MRSTVCWFIGACVSARDNSKSCTRIWVKSSGSTAYGTRTKHIDFRAPSHVGKERALMGIYDFSQSNERKLVRKCCLFVFVCCDMIYYCAAFYA